MSVQEVIEALSERERRMRDSTPFMLLKLLALPEGCRRAIKDALESKPLLVDFDMTPADWRDNKIGKGSRESPPRVCDDEHSVEDYMNLDGITPFHYVHLHDKYAVLISQIVPVTVQDVHSVVEHHTKMILKAVAGGKAARPAAGPGRPRPAVQEIDMNILTQIMQALNSREQENGTKSAEQG